MGENESERCQYLRGTIGDKESIRLLRLAPDEPAACWRTTIRAVGVVERAPQIKLVVGGGKPDLKLGPRFSAKARKLAANRGMVLHRWTGGGAFFVSKKEGEPLATIQDENRTQAVLV